MNSAEATTGAAGRTLNAGAGRLAAIATRALALAGAALLAGCAHNVDPDEPVAPSHKLFTHHHNHIARQALPASNLTTIGVNSYLWRASLDVLSFMPLVQTDSNGGVIVTDWYTNPGNPGERMKITVTILDRDLRSDALRVAGSRQIAQNGVWVDAPVQAATLQKLEDIILTKARDIRNGGVAH